MKDSTIIARNRACFYERASKILFVFIVLLLSFDAFSAECKRLNSSWTASNGEEYQSYQVSSMPSVDSCPYDISLGTAEYITLKVKAEMFDDVSPVTPESFMAAFTFGFGTYMMFWFLGKKGEWARKVIKSL